VASDRRWIALALAVLVTACGGDSNEKAEQEAAAKFAAQRARTDSIRQARRDIQRRSQIVAAVGVHPEMPVRQQTLHLAGIVAGHDTGEASQVVVQPIDNGGRIN